MEEERKKRGKEHVGKRRRIKSSEGKVSGR